MRARHRRTSSRWPLNSVQAAGDPYFVFPDEQRALDALEHDPRPGGVLAPPYGGHMLPYKTGREVYVGALSWTPDWDERVRRPTRCSTAACRRPAAPDRARQQARFLFVDCRTACAT